MTRHRSNQADLFDAVRAQERAPDGWAPSTPPELRGEKRIIIDEEVKPGRAGSSALAWWEGAKPVGTAYLLPESGRRGYLPIRHQGGGNLDEAVVLDWKRRELRGVHIDNINLKYDLHVNRNDGLDFESAGCTFGDVAHDAALLDDNRMRFNLEQLAHDFLGEDEGKYRLGLRDKGAIWTLPAWTVAPYAVHDCELVDSLLKITRPRLAQEDLLRVLKLEQEIISVVVEMEKNGTYLDVDLLVAWREKARAELQALLWEIYRESGVMLSSPDSPKDLEKLFNRLKLSVARTATGKPSFTASVMKSVKHPTIAKVIRAGHLADLLSKYLDKYFAAMTPEGWLRFNLHQLRYGRNEDEKGGAVSGRFSAAGDDLGGYNPQQVVGVEKQLERGWCPEYVIRRLFLPGSPEERRRNPNLRWAAADARQIEYRLFGHYTQDEGIIGAYKAAPTQQEIGGKAVWVTGPLADYHALVWVILNDPGLNRKLTKNTNFAKIYGAGLLKFAYMTDKINEVEYLDARAKYGKRPLESLEDPDYGAKIRAAHEVNQKYDRRFPSVKTLLRSASSRAEERGYVHTLLGRRARLRDRFHSALNRIVQGGAADINKRVTVEVYKLRRELGLTMRLTVHDELDCDIQDENLLPKLQQVLDTQYFDLSVPILWDVHSGVNWAEAKS